MCPWYDETDKKEETLEGGAKVIDFGKVKFISMPIGTGATLVNMGVTKVTNKPKMDFKNKDGISAGYHYVMKTDKGDLTIGAWSLFFELRNKMINEGLRFKLEHKGRGEYLAEIIDRDYTPGDIPEPEAPTDNPEVPF